MYHVISIGFTAIILYLISYFFYRIDYFSLHLHRKIWNTVLAVAFILTATAGVFIALQINYKWNIPFIKAILKWHVEFGIAMTITGLFHLIWHLKYYKKLFTATAENPEPKLQKVSKSHLRINLLIVGFVSSSIQFLLLREIMNITGGYELISGSFLGSWLVGSAIGVSLAARSKLNDIGRINVVFSVSPVLSLILLLFLSRVFVSPGESPSFLVSIVYTFIVLMPFCIVSGFTFIKLTTIAIDNQILPGKSFSIETIGGIAAGLIISLLTSGLLNTYKILLLIILICSCFTVISFEGVRIYKTIILCVFLIAGAFVFFSSPDLFFRKLLMPGIDVASTEDTPYGNITKGRYKGEESLYYDQKLIAYNDDATEREEDVHYAMLQRKSPENVIMISGSLRSHLPELLKYSVKSITYIERDPALAGYELNSENKFPDKVTIINKDAFRYIGNYSGKADIIILLTPPPGTLLLNRYYTTEFFANARKVLGSAGVFICSPGPGDSYYNKESMNLYSSVFNSLAANFKNVRPIVGNKLYFLASDSTISLSICALYEKRQIKNIYVNSDYLEDDLILKKSEEVSILIDRGMRMNKSAFPIACLQSQSYQFSKNNNAKIPSIILMFIVFVLPITAIKRKNLRMYFSASALAGFEIIVLLTFQILVGNMYQLTGLIIAGVMMGLAAGSGISLRIPVRFSVRYKLIILMLFYACFGLIFNYVAQLKGIVLSMFIIIISGFLPAFFTGHIYRSLTMDTEDLLASPGLIYSADLAGSAFGFIFISGFAIPLIGIQVSVYLLSLLIFCGIIFGKSNK